MPGPFETARQPASRFAFVRQRWDWGIIRSCEGPPQFWGCPNSALFWQRWDSTTFVFVKTATIRGCPILACCWLGWDSTKVLRRLFHPRCCRLLCSPFPFGCTFRAHRFLCSFFTRRASTTIRRLFRLPRERLLRRSLPRLPLQSILCRSRTFARRLLLARAALPFAISALGRLARLRGCAALLRRRQIDSSPARLRQSNGDRLLRACGSVLALADVIHLISSFTNSPACVDGAFPSRLSSSARSSVSFSGIPWFSLGTAVPISETARWSPEMDATKWRMIPAAWVSRRQELPIPRRTDCISNDRVRRGLGSLPCREQLVGRLCPVVRS